MNTASARPPCNRSSASRSWSSNGEFHAFVVAAAIRTRYWSDTGWEWRTFRISVADLLGPGWSAGLNRFRLPRLFEVIDMSWTGR